MSVDAPSGDAGSLQLRITDEAIQGAVLQAMRSANLARDASMQLVVSLDAPLFGPDSSLDSLGLVALLLDIEEALQALGCEVLLSDERAMSQKRSPFRTVSSMVAYIATVARGE
jgi:acyl carrier protein